MSRAAPLLRVAGLSVRYGAIEAVRGVDLAVGAREIVAIVGPNGAGKTSLLTAIAGIVPLAAGRIEFDAQPLAGLRLEDVVGRGIALVPEGRHIFATLTVEENLLVGATIRRDAAAVGGDIARFYDTFVP
jgi:branched-chain amino acid transport system ATP-binding protein